jgi:hypothetical protein
VNYGGPTDLWGQTWLPTDFGSNFSANYSIQRVGGRSSYYINVDAMQVTVFYVTGALIVPSAATKTAAVGQVLIGGVPFLRPTAAVTTRATISPSYYVYDRTVVSDTVGRNLTTVRPVVETLGASDSIVRNAQITRVPIELNTASDVLTRQYTAPRPITELSGRTFVTLPLLFSYIYMDAVTARVWGTTRSISETLTTSDSVSKVVHLYNHFTKSITETLTINDTLLRHYGARRNPLSDIESLDESGVFPFGDVYFGGDSMFTSRGSSWDSLTRQKGSPRINVESLLTTDRATRGAIRFGRHPIETLSFSDVLDPVAQHPRAIVITLTTNDVVTRTFAGGHRSIIEPLSLHDAIARHWTGARRSIETLSTVNVFSSLTNHPRSIFEYTTISDVVLATLMFPPIMGYIYYDLTDSSESLDESGVAPFGEVYFAGSSLFTYPLVGGTVVASLPDWGFVLIEDPNPAFGNTLNFAPITPAIFDPVREK